MKFNIYKEKIELMKAQSRINRNIKPLIFLNAILQGYLKGVDHAISKER